MSHQLEMEGGGLRSPRPSILALDLSLTSVGYCLNGAPGLIQCKLRGYDRISQIVRAITKLTFGVDIVVIEGYAFGVNYPGTAERHELAGCLKLWLYEHHITTVLVNPSTLKYFATGDGKAAKHNMLNAAIRRFHLGESHSQDDEVDAYLLWCAAREAYGGPIAKVPAAQAAKIHKLDWPKPARRDAA